RIDAFKSRLQRCRVPEIADEDVDAVAEARPCLLSVAHEDVRPVAALKQEFNDLGPNVSGRARHQVFHGGLLHTSLTICVRLLTNCYKITMPFHALSTRITSVDSPQEFQTDPTNSRRELMFYLCCP